MSSHSEPPGPLEWLGSCRFGCSEANLLACSRRCGYDSEIVRFSKRLQRRTREQLSFDGAEERRNIHGLHKVVVYLRVDGLEGRFKGRICPLCGRCGEGRF